jgi:hypothetical protein
MGMSLFAVALLPLWQVGEGEVARGPVTPIEQDALPLLPLELSPAASGQGQGTGSTTTVPQPVTQPPPPTQFDCIWKLINGSEECYCRPVGAKGARKKSDKCV